MTTLLVEPDQTITTPTVGGFIQRSRYWIGVVVFVALVVLGYTLLAPPSLTDQPLDSTGTGQTGARALVQVLEDHGVTVTATTSLAATEATIGDPGHTTVFVYDPAHYLDAAQLAHLPALARDVVVLSPGTKSVRAIDSNINLIGASTGAPSAHCTVAAARKAATLADGGRAYRVVKGAESGYRKCFPSGDDDYSLVQHVTPSSTLSIVGATRAFTNRYIGDAGNAALAINLLGSHNQLVWYLPSIEDLGARGNTETIAQAVPAWFGTFSILVLLVILAAAVWKGRRFGPLVIERMPVVVRSSETMEGRARLYQSTSARGRALDALRIGAITRIARYCGLSRTADVDEVAGAAAAVTGRLLSEVREILIGSIPHSDADLVRRSDDLLRLESDVASATGTAKPVVPNPGKAE